MPIMMIIGAIHKKRAALKPFKRATRLRLRGGVMVRESFCERENEARGYIRVIFFS
jgi:hypothetical protein